jgi:misacylated tRNA(Ala) deacylase
VPDLTTATELLYGTDSYVCEFDAEVVAVDDGWHAVALAATAFFPGGGGQPHDTGTLFSNGAASRVVKVAKDEHGVVWHALEAEAALPPAGATVHGALDWERRYRIMRTHTAEHVMNGIIWRNHRAHVTGANMTDGEGRLDFELPAMSQEFGRVLEARINEEVQRDRPVRVLFLPRAEADRDPSLMRLKADLIPRSVDPLRVIDIVGLDRQADGGTHVASTAEIGRVRVTKVQSKGKANKRVRIALERPAP